MSKKIVFAVIGVCMIIGMGLAIYQGEVYRKQVQLIAIQEERLSTQEKIISEMESKYQIKALESEKQINQLTQECKDKDLQIQELMNDINALEVKVSEITKETVFDSSNLRVMSGATIYHMQRALVSTDMYDWAQDIVDAANKYKINDYALAAIIAHEAGWGKSRRAQEDNNLTGYAVYSSSSPGKTFDSARESIMETARLLSEEYLTEGGAHYSGGLSVRHVNKKYCLKDGQPSYSWSASIISIARDLKNKANEIGGN